MRNRIVAPPPINRFSMIPRVGSIVCGMWWLPEAQSHAAFALLRETVMLGAKVTDRFFFCRIFFFDLTFEIECGP